MLRVLAQSRCSVTGGWTHDRGQGERHQPVLRGPGQRATRPVRLGRHRRRGSLGRRGGGAGGRVHRRDLRPAGQLPESETSGVERGPADGAGRRRCRLAHGVWLWSPRWPTDPARGPCTHGHARPAPRRAHGRGDARTTVHRGHLGSVWRRGSVTRRAGRGATGRRAGGGARTAPRARTAAHNPTRGPPGPRSRAGCQAAQRAGRVRTGPRVEEPDAARARDGRRRRAPVGPGATERGRGHQSQDSATGPCRRRPRPRTRVRHRADHRSDRRPAAPEDRSGAAGWSGDSTQVRPSTRSWPGRGPRRCPLAVTHGRGWLR
jgi:hypothetical protein